MFGYVKKKDFIAYQNKVNKELFEIKNPLKFNIGDEVSVNEKTKGIVSFTYINYSSTYDDLWYDFVRYYYVIVVGDSKKRIFLESELKLINNK